MNKKTAIRVLLAAVLLTAFTCACTKTETVQTNLNTGTVEANTANSNAAETAVSNASSLQESPPDALVKDLYKTHGEDFKNNTDRILNGKSRTNLDKYFDKTLADFFWKDLTTHKDEIGVLDFDPFYNAQDADIKKLNIGPPKIEGERATVVVTFENFGEKQTLTYLMVRQNAVWKISDIKYKDGSTLVGYFKADAKNNAETEEHFFAGTYRVGETTCTVKPVKMAFEVKWARGSGTMMFFFDGDESAGRYSYSSEDTGEGRDTFIFDDDRFETGRFVRADGREMAVRKIK
jgi:hypothetical protein